MMPQATGASSRLGRMFVLSPSGWSTFVGVLWIGGALLGEGVAQTGLCLACATGFWALWRKAGSRARLCAYLCAHLHTFWPLYLFVCWALVLPCAAGRWPRFSGAVRLLDWLALPLGSVVLARARSNTLLVWVFVLAMLSICAAGLQHYGLWFAQEDLAHILGWRAAVSRVYEVSPDNTARYLSGGLVLHRLKFAHTVMLLALVAWVYAWQAARSLSVRAAAAGMTVLALVAALLWAQTRACFAVGMVLTGLYTAVRFVCWLRCARLARARRTTGICAAALVLIVAVAGLSRVHLQRYTAKHLHTALQDRMLLWSSGWQAVRMQPWLGAGAGNLRAGHPAKDALPSHLRQVGKSHNQYLSVAAEHGALGLLLFVWLLAWLGRRFYLASKRCAAPRWVQHAGVLAVSYFVLLNILHDTLFHGVFSMAWVGVLAFLEAQVTFYKNAGLETNSNFKKRPADFI